MIVCVKDELVSINTNGVKTKRVVLLSDSVPSSLTLTGADVEGMDDTDIIAVGSTLIIPDKNYMTFSTGVFTEKE